MTMARKMVDMTDDGARMTANVRQRSPHLPSDELLVGAQHGDLPDDVMKADRVHVERAVEAIHQRWGQAHLNRSAVVLVWRSS